MTVMVAIKVPTAADLDADQRTVFLAELEIGLDGYTYLEP